MSHSVPSQPSGQKHLKELIPSMQVPPFLQGGGTQSFMSVGEERHMKENVEDEEDDDDTHTVRTRMFSLMV